MVVPNGLPQKLWNILTYRRLVPTGRHYGVRYKMLLFQSCRNWSPSWTGTATWTSYMTEHPGWEYFGWNSSKTTNSQSFTTHPSWLKKMLLEVKCKLNHQVEIHTCFIAVFLFPGSSKRGSTICGSAQRVSQVKGMFDHDTTLITNDIYRGNDHYITTTHY